MSKTSDGLQEYEREMTGENGREMTGARTGEKWQGRTGEAKKLTALGKATEAEPRSLKCRIITILPWASSQTEPLDRDECPSKERR
jgi:hypothetical protein